MIVDFSVKNYGPFRDEAKLSLQCTAGKEHPENVHKVAGIKGGLLTSAAVFGANASGKSKLFDAMAVLQELVRQPAPANIPIPAYLPFKLSPRNKGAPISMALTFTSGKLLFHYDIEFNSDKILHESLYYYPKGQRHKVFVRAGSDFSFGTGIVTGQKAISKMTGPNSAYLAVAAQMNNKICLQAHQEIVNNLIVLKGDLTPLINTIINKMNTNDDFKMKMVHALTAADLGIEDLNAEIKKQNLIDRKDLPPQLVGILMATGQTSVNTPTLYMKHHVGTAAGVTDADRTFPATVESMGTMRMFTVAGPIIDALQNGRTVVIDDFGAYLHHELCTWLIHQFGTATNEKGAQLIVNSNDLLLIDTDELLRRDQIYFTSKDSESGASTLYCLSDFRIRKDLDVRKAYDLGKFGAFPFINGGLQP